MDKLIGYTEFLNITIPFSRHTLTPRQETEILADMIINDNKNSRDLEILDLCTGSGCLGIAMANNLNARVTMSDISRKAIRRASRNARLNNAKVEIVRSNLFDNITSTFDIIISNPPYGARLADRMQIEVLCRDYGKMVGSLDKWCAYTLTSVTDFERLFGKKADKKRKLYNGKLECNVFSHLSEPPKKRIENK
jgi:methylase of polypeptide subunit release factors